MNAPKLLIATMTLSAVVACEDEPQGKIVRDVPTTATVGERFEHPLKAEPMPEHGDFRTCGENPVTVSDKKLYWLPGAAGKAKGCVELFTRTATVDKYEFEIEAKYPEGKSPEDLAKAIDEWGNKLKKAVEQAKTASLACSDAAGKVEGAFDEGYIAQLTGGSPGDLESALSLIRTEKASQILSIKKGEEPPKTIDDIAALIELTKQPRAVIIVADSTKAPKAGKAEPGEIKIDQGSLKGSAALVDLAQGKVLCKVPLTIQSSESVKVFSFGRDKPAPGFDPANQDFAQQAINALKKAFEKSGLELDAKVASPKKSE